MTGEQQGAAYERRSLNWPVTADQTQRGQNSGLSDNFFGFDNRLPPKETNCKTERRKKLPYDRYLESFFHIGF